MRRLIVTHFHPDHLGAERRSGRAHRRRGGGAGRAGRAALGRDLGARGTDRSRTSTSSWITACPQQLAERSARADAGSDVASGRRRPIWSTTAMRLELGGEQFLVRVLAGHADGHIVLLGEDTGRMFGGDLLLAEITPNVGRWPETAPDPLGAYLRVAGRDRADGSGDRLPRARSDDHRRRGPRGRDRRSTTPSASTSTWRRCAPGPTPPTRWRGWCGRARRSRFHEQRFALVEALSHLERLAAEGRAESPSPGHWRAL